MSKKTQTQKMHTRTRIPWRCSIKQKNGNCANKQQTCWNRNAQFQCRIFDGMQPQPQQCVLLELLLLLLLLWFLVVIVVAVNLSCSLQHRQHHSNCSGYDYCSFSVLYSLWLFLMLLLYFFVLLASFDAFVHITHSINQFCRILEFMICSIQLNFISISNNIVRNPANHRAPSDWNWDAYSWCVLFVLSVCQKYTHAESERRTKCWIHDGKIKYKVIVL